MRFTCPVFDWVWNWRQLTFWFKLRVLCSLFWKILPNVKYFTHFMHVCTQMHTHAGINEIFLCLCVALCQNKKWKLAHWLTTWICICYSPRAAYAVIKISCTFAAVCPFKGPSNGLNLVTQVPDALFNQWSNQMYFLYQSETFSFQKTS